MREKKEVQSFYDHIGWQKEGEGAFADAQQFEDLRPVSRDYIHNCHLHNCHLRLHKYLKHNGQYFLDVASGPLQYPEYLTYSEGFEDRLCVDISRLALKEPKKKLGDKGVYLLADITRLPLKDGSINAAVSIHTIYHVPANEQLAALHELYRVLRPESSAVVVYSWGNHSLLMNLAIGPLKPWQILKERIPRMLGTLTKSHSTKAPDDARPKLYFHAHRYQHFAKQTQLSNFDVSVWRSVSPIFTKTYVHSWLLGKQVLAMIYWLEDRFPRIAGDLDSIQFLSSTNAFSSRSHTSHRLDCSPRLKGS